MYYKGTYEECTSYDVLVTTKEGINKFHKEDNFSNPEKHPVEDVWRILLHKNHPSTMEIIKDWYEKES